MVAIMSENKTLREAKERFVWNIIHIFDTETYNPYLQDGEGDFTPKNRTAFEDFFHSLVNLPVEYLRSKGVSHPQRWVKFPMYAIAASLIACIIIHWAA